MLRLMFWYMLIWRRKHEVHQLVKPRLWYRTFCLELGEVFLHIFGWQMSRYLVWIFMLRTCFMMMGKLVIAIHHLSILLVIFQLTLTILCLCLCLWFCHDSCLVSSFYLLCLSFSCGSSLSDTKARFSKVTKESQRSRCLYLC